MRRVAVAVVALAVLLAVAYAAICGYMALTLTRPERRPFTHEPEQYGLRYQTVQFPSRVDRLPLSGWLLDPAAGVPAERPVVMVHGKGADRESEADGKALDIAADLTRHGHFVLMFDLRGSGRSGGEHFTLGAQEVRDVGGAVDFLAGRGLAGRGVDLLGFSMGAATSLLYAPTDSHVRAVAEDSGYADLGAILNDQVPKASGLPSFFTPGVVLMARPLIGIDAYTIRPIDDVPSLARRGVALLVIQGDRDATVPISNGYRIAAAYGPRVQTLFVHGAAHVGSYSADPHTYLTRLDGFFTQAEAAPAP